MPNLELPYQPELTPARLAGVLRDRFPDLEVKRTMRPGADLIAIQSTARGACLSVKQQPRKQRTIIAVSGSVPNPWLRIVLALPLGIPLAIADLRAHARLALGIAESLEQAPELYRPAA